jgi:hypothetical protein
MEENRIMKAHLESPLCLTDAERRALAEIGHRLGNKRLKEVAYLVFLSVWACCPAAS